MQDSVRKCVRDVNKGKNLEKLLPEYVEQAEQLYHGYAKVKLMMDYYIFYEMISENINPYIETAKDIAATVHQSIDELFGDGDKDLEVLRKKIDAVRQEVADKMQVLTAYVDRFVIYEYMLNRVQYRFDDMEDLGDLADDAKFAQKVVQFIFKTQDNVAVNDNIKAVLGQLPMRITRSHYYDIIRNALTIYKGGERDSLDAFLYMFKMSALLYKNADMDRYFTEFQPVMAELAEMDCDNMTKELYDIYAEKIRVNASKLTDISDLYMTIEQIINEVYSLILTAQNEEKEDEADIVVKGINGLFLEKGESFWNALGAEGLLDEQEKKDWLEKYFVAIEGRQEKMYEGISMMEGVLQETREAQKEKIEELHLTDAFRTVSTLEKLASNSIFMDLGDEMDDVEPSIVGEKEPEEIAEKLISDLKEEFAGKSRLYRRAIMANTLEKMPVFFNTPQEVADYVSTSLSQCNDVAEKYASKQLIESMLQ